MQQLSSYRRNIGPGIVLAIGLIVLPMGSIAAEENSLELSGAMSEVESSVQRGAVKLEQEATSLVKTLEENEPLKLQLDELKRWSRALQVKIELMWSKVKKFFKD